MSEVYKGWRLAVILGIMGWATNTCADYWRVKIVTMEQPQRFGSIEYLFKIESYDFVPKSHKGYLVGNGEEDLSAAKTILASSGEGDKFFVTEKPSPGTRYPYRNLASTDSRFRDGHPKACGKFEMRVALTDGTVKTAIESRSAVLPTIYAEFDGELYILARVSGIAFAENGSRYSGLVPGITPNAPDLAGYDVMRDAAFWYDRTFYDSICRSYVTPKNGVKERLGWAPMNTPRIEFLTESEGRAAFDKVVMARAKDAVKQVEISKLREFREIVEPGIYSKLESMGKEYWYPRYQQDAAAVFDTQNPGTEALRAFSEKVSFAQAVRWDSADFDDLAGKANKMYEVQWAREQKAAAEEKKQLLSKLSAWRKKLAVGDDTFCGPVIEVKPPMIKIAVRPQLPGFGNEAWLKASEVFPESNGCINSNGRLFPNQ